MTQKERILAMLNSGPVCGYHFFTSRMPRAAARIAELRKDGYQIVTRPCRFHEDCHSVVYELVGQDQLALNLGLPT